MSQRGSDGNLTASVVQCNAVQFNPVQYSAVQCNPVKCITIQCNAVQYRAVQCSAVCGGRQIEDRCALTPHL